MITGRDFIFISSIEWDFQWQLHQEVALRLVKAGNRVLYIENTGVRSPKLRDAKRVAVRLKNSASSHFSRGVREVHPHLYVVAPMVLPPFGSKLRRLLNRRLLLTGIKRLALRLGMRDPIIWTYLPTDTAVDLINLLRTPGSIVIYYCGADFSQLTPHQGALSQSETMILEMANLVFTFCRELEERCQKWNPNVHVIPAGVDLDSFLPEEKSVDAALARSASTEQFENSFSSSLQRPIIGYVGGLHKFVDYELLTTMARRRPQWSWVFVGAIQTTIGELAKFPNVHLLGQQPHQNLADYIRRFDVCLIPYLNSAATATALPLKLNEYLAVGKPVVSTLLPTVCEFNQLHRILITATNQPDSFLAGIEEALRLPNDPHVIEQRREIAAIGDWKHCLNVISQLIEAAA
jgi:glycosyltransferase involved in cell wall biosynthesis